MPTKPDNAGTHNNTAVGTGAQEATSNEEADSLAEETFIGAGADPPKRLLRDIFQN